MSVNTRQYMGVEVDEWQHTTEQLIRLLADTGATTFKHHVFWDWWYDNVTGWITGERYQTKLLQIRQWCIKYGLKFIIQIQANQYDPPEGWDTFKKNAILNVNGAGDTWISKVNGMVAALRPDVVGVMNEPSDMGLTMSQYLTFINRAMNTWKATEPNTKFIVDAMPFWDFTGLAANPIIRPDVFSQVHYHYAYEHTYPQPYEQEQIAYWNGNLAQARILLFQALLSGENLQAMFNVGMPVIMGEIGGHILNANIMTYLQDMYDFAKQYNMGFIQHAFRAWDPVLNYYQSGMLDTDDLGNNTASWTRFNDTLGLVFQRNMPSALPPVTQYTLTVNSSKRDPITGALSPLIGVPFTVTKVG